MLRDASSMHPSWRWLRAAQRSIAQSRPPTAPPAQKVQEREKVPAGRRRVFVWRQEYIECCVVAKESRQQERTCRS